MDKHTPGPWNVVLEDQRDYIGHYIDDGNKTIAETVCAEAGTVSEEEAANARLIAAAPELLAALEDVELRCTQARIASTIGREKGRVDFLRGELERIAGQARAAIAKATRSEST